MTHSIVTLTTLLLVLTACGPRPHDETYEWTYPTSTYVPPVSPPFDLPERSYGHDSRTAQVTSISHSLAMTYDALVMEIKADLQLDPIETWEPDRLRAFRIKWDRLEALANTLRKTMADEGIQLKEGFKWPDFDSVRSHLDDLLNDSEHPERRDRGSTPGLIKPKLWA